MTSRKSRLTIIEDVVVKSLEEHVRSQSGMPASTLTDLCAIAALVDRIDVHKDRLVVQLTSRENPGTIKSSDDIEPTGDRLLSIPWQKPPSKRFRQILLPHGSSRSEVRPDVPRFHRQGGRRRQAKFESVTPISMPRLTCVACPCRVNATS